MDKTTPFHKSDKNDRKERLASDGKRSWHQSQQILRQQGAGSRGSALCLPTNKFGDLVTMVNTGRSREE
ncbi:MAG: hypothetical protein ACRDEA_04530 [Microcystaceae cyanobacterium]